MKVDPVGRLLLGLATGAVFGGLLQRGRVARYDTIMRQLLLRDGSVAKVMGSAVAVGAAGVHALTARGKAELVIKPLHLGGVIVGGVLFGTGLALLGYCPGTSLVAAAEGRRDARVGVLGMLAGAALFVRAYPALKPLIEAGDLGQVTLSGATGTSAWPWVAAAETGLGVALLKERRPALRGRLG